MKSEKAKEILSASSVTDSYDYEYLLLSCAEKAVECAEQEAEERMRRKALSAFDDMWFENGEDGEFEPDYEYHRRNFIQKLNEE